MPLSPGAAARHGDTGQEPQACWCWFLARDPMSPDPGQPMELTQDLAQDLARWRQELGGGTEAQVMEPIHFEKVPWPQGSGRWLPCPGGC